MSTKTTMIAKEGFSERLFAGVVSFETFVKGYVCETASGLMPGEHYQPGPDGADGIEHREKGERPVHTARV